ncbi:hypothetical protein [Blastococcus sp. SYSU DS0616]
MAASSGAATVTTACTRSASARWGAGISAILSSTSCASAAAFPAPRPRRPAVSISAARCLIASRSSVDSQAMAGSLPIIAAGDLPAPMTLVTTPRPGLLDS